MSDFLLRFETAMPFSPFLPVTLTQLLVPGGLLFAFTLGVLWVARIARQAKVRQQQEAHLNALNAPKKGENHHSMAHHAYQATPKAVFDPKQEARWQQWLDLQGAGQVPRLAPTGPPKEAA